MVSDPDGWVDEMVEATAGAWWNRDTTSLDRLIEHLGMLEKIGCSAEISRGRRQLMRARLALASVEGKQRNGG